MNIPIVLPESTIQHIFESPCIGSGGIPDRGLYTTRYAASLIVLMTGSGGKFESS